ncbi:hypothetical protein DIE06_07015 [Burkholderia sp. Bp8998]|nr:hypothetical protein DIE06_07015 [Burkholderia sp. Bp8998]
MAARRHHERHRQQHRKQLFDTHGKLKATPSRARGADRGVWSEYSGHCTGAIATVPCDGCASCALGVADATAMIGAR